MTGADGALSVPLLELAEGAQVMFREGGEVFWAEAGGGAQAKLLADGGAVIVTADGPVVQRQADGARLVATKAGAHGGGARVQLPPPPREGARAVHLGMVVRAGPPPTQVQLALDGSCAEIREDGAHSTLQPDGALLCVTAAGVEWAFTADDNLLVIRRGNDARAAEPEGASPLRHIAEARLRDAGLNASD